MRRALYPILFRPPRSRLAVVSAVAQFFAGRPGVFYTPDDVSTLSSSRVGASFGGLSASSPVGMMLDVSRGGLQALGPEATVAGWVNSGAAFNVFSTAGASFTGEKTTAGGTALAHATNTVSVTQGRWYQVTVNVIASTLFSYELGLSFGANSRSTAFGTSGAGLKVGYVFANVASGNFTVSVRTTHTGSITVESASVRELPGTHQVAPSDAARPILQPFAGTGPLAAQFDGSTMSMGSLSTLDLTSTDAVTVIAGVRKLSDTTTGVVVESSPIVDSNNGSFGLFAPASNGTVSYRYISRGSASANAGVGIFAAAPDTAVLIGRSKISPASIVLDHNRGQNSFSGSASQGTGNYGNYPLFLGARNNTTLRLNGQIARLGVFGWELTPEELAIATELAAQPYGL
jgi:hypothetical protein